MEDSTLNSDRQARCEAPQKLPASFAPFLLLCRVGAVPGRRFCLGISCCKFCIQALAESPQHTRRCAHFQGAHGWFACFVVSILRPCARVRTCVRAVAAFRLPERRTSTRIMGMMTCWRVIFVGSSKWLFFKCALALEVNTVCAGPFLRLARAHLFSSLSLPSRNGWALWFCAPKSFAYSNITRVATATSFHNPCERKTPV